MFGGVKPVRRLYVETRPAACHLTTWRLLTKVGGHSRFFSSRPPVCDTSLPHAFLSETPQRPYGFLQG